MKLTPREYNYRGGPRALAGYFVTGFILTSYIFIAVAVFSNGARASNSRDAYLPIGVGMLTFLCGGLWFLISSFKERIVVTDDSVEWYGWMGKLKVKASFDEITELYGDDGPKYRIRRNGRVYTRNGIIKFDQDLYRNETLCQEIRMLLDSRNQVETQ